MGTVSKVANTGSLNAHPTLNPALFALGTLVWGTWTRDSCVSAGPRHFVLPKLEEEESEILILGNRMIFCVASNMFGTGHKVQSKTENMTQLRQRDRDAEDPNSTQSRVNLKARKTETRRHQILKLIEGLNPADGFTSRDSFGGFAWTSRDPVAVSCPWRCLKSLASVALRSIFEIGTVFFIGTCFHSKVDFTTKRCASFRRGFLTLADQDPASII